MFLLLLLKNIDLEWFLMFGICEILKNPVIKILDIFGGKANLICPQKATCQIVWWKYIKRI
jgi:hypothetical protein